MTPLDESGMWIFGLKFGDRRDLSTWDGICFWVRSPQHGGYPDRYYLIRSRSSAIAVFTEKLAAPARLFGN
ncbi:hypothetical protein [Microcoleus sp. CAWBG58]|uniref:hypothetical protein n=1 Tax=Microcoleus sp. CAWBG58 TaxID=2841651 RepID=UPI0025D4D86C|nr:hypothetical protein [Microcoleus sp. CAWBG58]